MYDMEVVTINRNNYASDEMYIDELENIIAQLSEQSAELAAVIDEIFALVDEVVDEYADARDFGGKNEYAEKFLSIFADPDSIMKPSKDEIH